MKISVIVPVYNCEKYIDKCILSVINQKYNNWELILINNGSTDSSKSICEKYSKKDDRIILINSTNEGPSVARNKGINRASGDYIMFIDGDDYIEKDTFNILINEIKRNDYQLVFYGNYNDTFINNQYIQNGENKYIDYEIENNDDLKCIYEELSNRFLVNQVWNKLYKKSFIEEVGTSFPEGINYSEDLIFNIKLYKNLQKGKVINKSLYHYVNHKGDSLCSVFNPKKFDYLLYVYEIVEKELREWDNSLINQFSIFFIKDINIYINSLFNKDCKISFREKKNYVKRIINEKIVKEVIKNTKLDSIRIRITSLLIKFKLKYMLLLMGKVTRMIKKN